MAKAIGLFTAILLTCVQVAPEQSGFWTIWNVGQGQWVTFHSPSYCHHFDMGGEKAPWSKIARACQRKINFIFLSHWDWDHISFVGLSTRHLPNACVYQLPNGEPTPRKRKWVTRVRRCPNKPNFVYWENDHATNANGWSRVALWKNMLLPGDSTSREEKIWIQKLLKLSSVKWLVAGHHGSRTSTSRRLLAELPGLKMAFASARYSRYGHPHRDVTRDLRRFRVPLISTEDWGDIHIY